MKRRAGIVGCFLSVLVGVGCSAGGTPDGPAGTNPAASTPAATTSPAVAMSPAAATSPDTGSAAATPPADSSASASAPGSIPSAAASATIQEAGPVNAVAGVTGGVAATASPAAIVESPEIARKRAQIEWALKENEISSDPNGQWAVQAKGSSTYNGATGTAAFAANQAAGPANVESYGNSASAWTAKTPDAGIEWLDLQYAKPVYASAVRVRESYGSGAVIKVEVFDEKGVAHTIWSGTDPTKDLNYFVVEFPRTAFKTGRVKLTLATNVVPGWNQIDAVQLVGTDQR